MIGKLTRRAGAAAVAAVALVGTSAVALPAHAALDELPQGPSGSNLWDAVTPRNVEDGAQPGDIRWVQERPDAPEGARGWNVIYASETAPGEPIYVSGEIYAPTDEATEPRPIVLWNHETVGNADVCAPSRRSLNSPWGTSRVPGLDALIDAGYVVVMSDYPGLGLAGPAYYMAGQANARASIDIARAATQIDALNTGNQVATYGWSQGGQTSFWAVEMVQEYAPELEFVGAGLIAPAADIRDLTERSMTETFLAGYVIATLPGIKAAHPELDYADFLTVEGLSEFPAMADGCWDIWSTAAGVEDPYQPDAMAEGSPWWEAMTIEQDYDWSAMNVPFITIQGTDDDTTPLWMAERNHENLCEAGATSALQVVPEGTHSSVVPIAAETLPGWFADRFAGVEAEDTCAPGEDDDGTGDDGTGDDDGNGGQPGDDANGDGTGDGDVVDDGTGDDGAIVDEDDGDQAGGWVGRLPTTGAMIGAFGLVVPLLLLAFGGALILGSRGSAVAR